MHDEVKKELLDLNKDCPENQSILEAISKHSFESFQEITTRRFIKTHFPFSLLPPSVLENGAKVSQQFYFYIKTHIFVCSVYYTKEIGKQTKLFKY